MEEDAGKSTHKDGYSLVDLNRQGTPLIEIVSLPKEAYAYLENYVQSFNIQVYLIVKWKRDPYVVMLIFHFVHMVKGIWYKTELKNLNSFNYVKKV